MIVAAAFCPHPPVLVPEVAQGAAPELDALRAACLAAIGRIARPERRILIIGSGTAALAHGPSARGTFAGFGVDLEISLGSDSADDPGEPGLPLSLTVGAWLAREALGPNNRAFAIAVVGDVAPQVPDELLDDRTDWALLVMGDGSARRSAAAPGYLDERAEPFDAAVAAALRSGSGAALTALAGADLLVAGLPAWHAAGRLLTRDYDADLLYDAAPYGVGYFVATWT